mgnify:CR=1 FL=1
MKNDAEEYLKKEGIAEDKLGTISQKALHVFKQLKALHLKDPGNEAIKEKAEQSGLNTIQIIQRESPPTPNKGEEAKKEKPQKSKADQVKEETPKVLDKLEKCKILIKEERKRKIASGEIKAPKKTTRYTKIKNAFVRILKLMPSENTKELKGSYNQLLAAAQSVFKLHGLKQAHLIEKELREVYQSRLKKIKHGS